ncbi:MAG: FAD-dependent oxidoreductase [Bacteroidales bacterium]|nr:FAD-dependent oxidoreductase [Bacteroidales bacterium]
MAIVKKYPAKVIAIHSSIESVYTLEFESLDKPFKYAPGQFLHLAIDCDYDGSGQWPESRCFSMKSNPDEETIKITYSLKGIFTKQMKQSLKVGSEVWLKLPYGDLFTQYHNKTNTVFIAGGTGITPFLSLFTHVSFINYINPKIYLGFRSKEHNIYQPELDSMCNSHSFIKIYYEDKDGILDIQNITDENCLDSSYFISGPPAMIKAFKQTLMLNGVDSMNIITDNWE